MSSTSLSAAIHGTGSLANILTGNSGDNTS